MSSDRHRPRTTPTADDVTGSPPTSPASVTDNRIPHTRTGAAWFAVCSAALLCVVLIIFMTQNTRRVEVTFLWTHTSLPLALALLIAAVGATILAVVVGAARITQLRHLYRRGHGN
ncbi:lipopolysaccharide assembly protein LapA domain-containing protein [Actinoplanes missouriensis]|uniref:lipopolysaccharide assembly protein LapA domain-containing protein n=1 Tax=Actinoplanes missouriensis TaxID=1866 RepID=UPI00340BC6B2